MDRILNRVGNGLYILGDLNGWKGDRVRASISGAFRVPRVNDNGGCGSWGGAVTSVEF